MLCRDEFPHSRNSLLSDWRERMRIVHLSDLHLGKRVNAFSMMEDQEFILKQIISIIDDRKPDAVLIAGDVYDRSVPSEEAVRLFDRFLSSLAERKLQVFVISGNHDSADRLSFGSDLMSARGIHISKGYDGTIAPDILEDPFGRVYIWCLPFLRAAEVRRYFPDEPIENDTDAIRAVISGMDRLSDARHILIAHQFVSGALTSDSETVSVGGTDAIDPCVFEGFDYIALGHLHRPQSVGRDTLRYCGTPLKYSFSEKDQEKSVTIAELGEKGSVRIETVPLKPLHDLREIRGTYEEVTAKSFYENTDVFDYLRVVLTDEQDIPDAIRRLAQIYPNIMQLDYDNIRTRSSSVLSDIRTIEEQTPVELFAAFYEKQNGQAMNEDQKKLAETLFEEIGRERV